MKASLIALAVLAAGASSVASAQVVKCTDRASNVTYSNVACEKQGLRSAGPVQHKLMSGNPTAADLVARETLPANSATGAVALAPRAPDTTATPSGAGSPSGLSGQFNTMNPTYGVR